MGRAPAARADARRNARLPSGVSSLRSVSFFRARWPYRLATGRHTIPVGGAARESPSGTERRLISEAVVQTQAGLAALTWLASRGPNFCILHSKPGRANWERRL